MIYIARSLEPKCLSENGERWLNAFLESSSPRPNSRQYGHPEVRDALHAMSFDKCFYCEQKVGEHEAQVEHFVSITENPNLAFVWANLYLSCQRCNQAKRKPTPAISDCLDPCDASHDPADHLTFEDEYIRSRANSVLGRNTIQKYSLNREDLAYKRTKWLLRFVEFLLVLEKRGQVLTEVEKEKIRSFAGVDHEFSLMFRVRLDAEPL